MNEEIYEDIEPENNENLEIKIPFDPNLIKISTKPMTLGQIIDMIQNNKVNLFTEYQRLPDLWNDVKKSKLIESILLRLPLPNFYFDADDENHWSVVDGLQRISTLKSFVIDQTLTLQKMEFLTEYNGMKYNHLPRPLQRRILTFPIIAYIIDKGTPDVVKYNIFSRINQGGLLLTPQEIRQALHQGTPADLIADLVRGEDKIAINGSVLKKATAEGRAFVKAVGRISTERMQDRDFATRFASFYLIDYRKYKPDMDSFLNRGMGRIKFLTSEEIQRLKDDFRAAMELAWDVFGSAAFRKKFPEGEKRGGINKALFETFSVTFGKLSHDERMKINSQKDQLQKMLDNALAIRDSAFFQSITSGTALTRMVIVRFFVINQMVKQVLTHA